MGTVGLNFGSGTSGQGFDVATTVSSILAINQAIETPWKNQVTALQAQDTVLSTLGTDLGTLATSMSALTDFEGVTAEKEGSSSDTNVLALTSAGATAAAGNHNVTVSQLAQTSSVYTDAVANASDGLSGSITIQVGSGSAQTIAVPSGSNTLAGLSAAINAAGIGVTASLISDKDGTRLSLVSGTSGTAGQLAVTSGLMDTTSSTSLGTQVGLDGKDAELTVDGVSLVESSNTVSTAIPGVTFQLLSPSTDPVDVQITNDTGDMSTAMQTFVTAYNAVVGDLKTQEGNDASGNPEPLYGSPTVSMLQSQMSSGLLGGAASGSISSLTQLGVTVNDDGTLTYSESDFTSAVNSDFNDVVGFFQNTGSWGQTFSNVLDRLGMASDTGVVYLAEQENTSLETTLNADVSNEETLLATEKTTLTAELNTANEEMQAIPSQLSEVNEMYSAVTGYNTNTNG